MLKNIRSLTRVSPSLQGLRCNRSLCNALIKHIPGTFNCIQIWTHVRSFHNLECTFFEEVRENCDSSAKLQASKYHSCHISCSHAYTRREILWFLLNRGAGLFSLTRLFTIWSHNSKFFGSHSVAVRRQSGYVALLLSSQKVVYLSSFVLTTK